MELTPWFLYRSTSNAGAVNQLMLPAPPIANGQATTPTKVDPKMDLLSGDDFNSPTAENMLAIVPVGEPQTGSPIANHQNALALVDMFSQNNSNQPAPAVVLYSSMPQYQQQQNLQPPQNAVYPNGIGPNMMAPQYEQPLYNQGANSAWNGQILPQQQPPSPVYGAFLIHSLMLIYVCCITFSQSSTCIPLKIELCNHNMPLF